MVVVLICLEYLCIVVPAFCKFVVRLNFMPQFKKERTLLLRLNFTSENRANFRAQGRRR